MIDGGYDGRIREDDRAVFTLIGLGSIDIAIAEHVYRSGIEDGIGGEFLLSDTEMIEERWI
ncbi:hypothetical protein [Natronorubrum aibiense]|uniref:Uncharacterized protein n=1 Tax=Natronorubrum aibiense TaxID=348826 RepID=A0A5P9P8K0_9EURY|nr:hypothetical protein [Natronorubrum aibiense]QFU84436.1 hypothetical protein GCU68_18050 [Natronorubrum aibiense]